MQNVTEANANSFVLVFVQGLLKLVLYFEINVSFCFFKGLRFFLIIRYSGILKRKKSEGSYAHYHKQ